MKLRMAVRDSRDVRKFTYFVLRKLRDFEHRRKLPRLLSRRLRDVSVAVQIVRDIQMLVSISAVEDAERLQQQLVALAAELMMVDEHQRPLHGEILSEVLKAFTADLEISIIPQNVRAEANKHWARILLLVVAQWDDRLFNMKPEALLQSKGA